MGKTDFRFAVFCEDIKDHVGTSLPRKTLADAFAYRGEHGQAIEQLQRLLELNDRFWLAYFSLANVYTAQGMTREAIDACERGLQIAPHPRWSGCSLPTTRAPENRPKRSAPLREQ
jgi:tetratricopeptide (TPR) repeat protein